MWFKTPKHTHNFKIIRVEKAIYAKYPEGDRDCTRLYLKCKDTGCIAVKLDSVFGTWKMSDFE